MSRERSFESRPGHWRLAQRDAHPLQRARRVGPESALADALSETAEDLAREKLGRGVAAAEGGDIVEIAVIDVAQHCLQHREREADVADEAIAVELRAAQLHLDAIGGAVQLLRRAEDLAEEAVGDHEMVADGKAVHRCLSSLQE